MMEDDSTPSQNLRDPLAFIEATLKDLIRSALYDSVKTDSRIDWPSLYLSRCTYVSGGKQGARYFSHLDAHVKDQDHAADVAQLRVKLVVENKMIVEHKESE